MLAFGFQPGRAQGRGGDLQSQLLLEAATLESRADLDGAETALRRLLNLDPTSSGAVFAMERVLRAKGEVAELLPIVDAFLELESDPDVHGLKLALLAEVGSTPDVVAEAERWISSDRTDPVTYRKVAEVYERVLGPERALAVLREGRTASADESLSLEIGDVLASGDDLDGALDQWARAVGEDGSGTEAVRARLMELGDRGPDAAQRVVDALAESGSQDQLLAALRIAIELRLEPKAMELAQRYEAVVDDRARPSFLGEVGRRSRDYGLVRVAAWAYEELREDTESPEERRQLDERIVALALESGDTAVAMDAQRRLAASYDPRSEEHRRRLAELIGLEATAAPDHVVESWSAFRSDFPKAPELDGVGAKVAASLMARGDADGAAEILDGIDGPRSSLERAYILFAGGDIEGGRGLLLVAVSGLPASEATDVIQFASLLGRLSADGAQVMATAGTAAHLGRGEEAASALVDEAGRLDEADRAPILAEAARIAERGGDPETAARIRQRIITDHPDAPEVGEASLALARHVAGAGGDDLEAIRLLEDLITSRPNAAVVPEARLELERLRNRGS